MLPTGEKIKKRSRTPVTHQLRCSSRVSAARVHADVEIDLTVPPPRKTKKGPSLRQLELADKIFSDDVDKNLQYYVCEVKYYEPYDQVCCLCVPYYGDVVKAKCLLLCTIMPTTLTNMYSTVTLSEITSCNEIG